MPVESQHRITFQPLGLRANLPAGESLLAATQAAGIGLASPCGGVGSCECCLVRLVSGQVAPPTLIEQGRFTAQELVAGWRLACQALPLSDLVIEIPPESLTAPQRLQIESLDLPTGLAPQPEARAGEAPLPGLALDIGTTKLAAYLCDLRSAKVLAQAGAMNPQIIFGEDVISRIAYTQSRPEHAATLQARLVEAVNQLAADLCKRARRTSASIQPEQIAEIVAVGNTAMHHLLAGLPVQQLGVAPYRPAVTDALRLEASTLGLIAAPGASVYFPPNIAGFVGADHAAMLLAAGMLHAEHTALALDIGTNTEITLVHQGRRLSCSCASGPAFEGAHIHAGMRAAPGAVERIWTDGESLRLQTIEALPPVGLCGSGILDGIAAMRQCGALDRRGALDPQHPRVQRSGGQLAFLVAPAAQTATGSDLVITRSDVNEIQLAKAAIRAGVRVLLNEAGLTAEALQEFIIAGAFGTYLHLPSAIAIGMFPRLPLERFRQIGNAAGAGARLLLCSEAQRALVEQSARQIEYVELSSHPDFKPAYSKALFFDD